MFVVRLLGINALLGEDGGVLPAAVVELGRKPICRPRFRLHARVCNISPNRAALDALSFPASIGYGAVREFQDKSCVADMIAVLEARIWIGIVMSNYGQRHWIFRQEIDAYDVVREKRDGIDDREPAVDVER